MFARKDIKRRDKIRHGEMREPGSPKGEIGESDQQLVFDLMRTRLFELFGPAGAFRVVLARGVPDDAVFVSTITDAVARDVAVSLVAAREMPAKRVAVTTPYAEHEAMWRHLEAELLGRRTGVDSLDLTMGERVPDVGVPAVRAHLAA